MHSKMVGLDSPPPILLLLSFYHLWQVQLLFCLYFPRVLYPSHCLCLHSKKQGNCHFPSAMTALKRALPAKSSMVIPLMLFLLSQQPARSNQLRLPRTLLCTSLIRPKSRMVLSLADVGKHVSKATVPNLTPSNAQEVPESLRRMGGCHGKGDSPLETKRYVDNQYRPG